MLKRASSMWITNTMSRILIIYSGGTIGMVKCPKTKAYIPQRGYLKEKIKTFASLYDKDYEFQEGDLLTDHEPRATPVSMYGRRIIYCIEEMDPILDSANMSMEDWALIAKLIEKYYRKFDGFVIVHGTDTMAYTASALSFMLENLGKSIVLTGSQIPLEEQRNDGVNNLLGALIFASHYVIPEVTIFFNNKLFRGNRSLKQKSEDIDAFNSPNMAPLAVMGTHIVVNWNNIGDCASTALKQFCVQSETCSEVAMLRLFPGMTCSTLHHFLAPPIKGAVILSYGAGNGPDSRQDLLDVFRSVCARGVIVVNITQCLAGTVSVEYNTGKVLSDAGILPGGDMTPEAALAKLAYLIAKPGITLEDKRKMMVSNLRGEMTVEVSANVSDLFLDSESYLSKSKMRKRRAVQASYNVLELGLFSDSYLGQLIASLEVSSQKEMQALREAILPTVMCNAAGLGKLDKLKEAVQQCVSVNKADYDGRTPLHLAACEGHKESVEFLLKNGAIVHCKDRAGNTPLVDAIKNKHVDVVKLMLKTGAHLQYSEAKIADAVCLSVLELDPEQIDLWKLSGANLSALNSNKSTPLHVSVFINSPECYKKLLECGADPTITDESGLTAADMITALKRTGFD